MKLQKLQSHVPRSSSDLSIVQYYSQFWCFRADCDFMPLFDFLAFKILINIHFASLWK